MSRQPFTLLIALVLTTSSSPQLVRASRALYIFEGRITGTFLGGDPTFTDQPFVFTLTGDTDSVRHVGDGIYELPVDGMIQIDTQGTTHVDEDLHLWCDFGPRWIGGDPMDTPEVGLSVGSFDSGGYVNLGASSPALQGYMLDRNFGPVDVPYAITGIPETGKGVLDDFGERDVTFRAVVSDSPPPPPSGIPLPPPLAAGAAGLMLGYGAIAWPRLGALRASRRTCARRCSASR